MIKNTIIDFLKKSKFLSDIYNKYSTEIESILDFYRPQEESTRKKTPDFQYNYQRVRKFSDLAKELAGDERKYRTFYCDRPAPSVNGYIKILNRHKLHQVQDNWDIFIPNGYNRIELDLNELKPTRPDQVIFGIPGCDELVGKSCVWKNLEKAYGREKAMTIMPQTFVLENEDHMNLFKEHYKEGETYILKKKKQRKEGLLLTKDINEILTAKEKEYTIVQDYNRNVLLVNNRKLNLRIYLLLTLKNGVLEAHINKYGTCIYNNKDYDDTTLDFEKNITSFNLDLKIYDKNPLTIKQLMTYLKDKGYENPDILLDRINEKVKLLCEAIKPKIVTENLKDNLCLQVFGMDFIVDKDLNPYLLECNKGPDMSPKIDSGYADLINKLEDFYMSENLLEKSYPSGYKSGNGLKVQRDLFKYMDFIDLKSSNNGFYKVY